MGNQDKNNERWIRDIRNLSPEDLTDIYSIFMARKRKKAAFTGRVFPNAGIKLQATLGEPREEAPIMSLDAKHMYQQDIFPLTINERYGDYGKTVMPMDSKELYDTPRLYWNHFTRPCIEPINEIKKNEVCKTDFKFLYDDIRYRVGEAQNLYPYEFYKKMTDMEILLYEPFFTPIEKEVINNHCEIDENHLQYNFVFNIFRRRLGLISIEIKLGELYYIKMGSNIKLLKLIKLDGDISENDRFSCYFRDPNKENDKPMKIGYTKIMAKRKDDGNSTTNT